MSAKAPPRPVRRPQPARAKVRKKSKPKPKPLFDAATSARIGRVVVWTAIVLVGLAGLTSIVHNVVGGPAQLQAEVDPLDAFPRAEASALAAQFVHDWGTWEEGDRDAHAARIRPYLANDVDPNAGWNGIGSQVAAFSTTRGLDVLTPSTAVATVAVEVTGPRWLYLSVPLVADPDTNTVAVAGPPAFLPVPPPADLPGVPEIGDADADVANSLTPELEDFFTAYADGDATAVRRFTDVPTGTLGGQVAFDSIGSLQVDEPDSGGVRQVRVAVVFVDDVTGSAVQMGYQMSVSTDGQRWFVHTLAVDAAQATTDEEASSDVTAR